MSKNTRRTVELKVKMIKAFEDLTKQLSEVEAAKQGVTMEEILPLVQSMVGMSVQNAQHNALAAIGLEMMTVKEFMEEFDPHEYITTRHMHACAADAYRAYCGKPPLVRGGEKLYPRPVLLRAHRRAEYEIARH